jgi:cobalt/nickel transport system permease protein
MSRTSAGFAERSIHSLLDAVDYAARAEKRAETAGLMQAMDARLKLAGVLLVIVAVVTSRALLPIAAVFGGSVLLAIASGIRVRAIATTVWIPALLFTGAIALPSVFLVQHGARSAAFLVLRSITCATLSALLVFSTPWPALLKGLRALRVPAIAVTILGMAYRYLFSTLDIARDMLESRRSRTVGPLSGAEQRRMAAGAAGVLLSRSVLLSREVHLAMLSRGFRGEAFTLANRPILPQDWAYFAGFTIAAASVFWVGR